MPWRLPPLLLAALLLLLAPPETLAQEAESIRLQASQDFLQANGYSTAAIVAEVRNRGGDLVPDGTEVRFTTTLGTIDPVATTVAGTARVTLRSAATPGTAVILATSGRAQREIRIGFLAEGQAPPSRLRVIVCEADYLAFSTDYGVVAADGNVRVTLGSLKLSADTAQVDVQKSEVRLESISGQQNVVLSDGGLTWRVERAVYSWLTNQGLMTGGQSASDAWVRFTGPPLAAQDQAEPGESNFAFVDLDDTGLWIVSRRIAIFPNLRIQFKKAEFRPAGKKLLSLPYHSLPLTIGGVEDNIVGVGSEGLTLDLPFYLRLTDNSASTLRFGYNQREGSLGAIRKGFGLDLRHRTFGYDDTGDIFNLSRITSSDWGAWWRHARRWGDRLQTHAYVEFPDHRALFATGNISHQGGDLNAYLSLTANAPRGFPLTTFSELSLQTTPKPLGRTGLQWSFISSSGYATGLTAGKAFSQSVQARLALPGLRLSPSTVATTALTAGRNLAGSTSGGVANFIFSLSQRVGSSANLSVNYMYDQRPGFGPGNRHRVGGQFLLTRGNKWSLSTIGNYSLDGGSASLFGQLSYYISEGLRVDLRSTYFRTRNFPFSDYEIAIAKTLMGRDLIVYWSKQRHRIQVEYAAATF